MDQNLTDDRTTVGSHDDRSSGGVFLMPSERRMREAVSIQPHARTLACAKPISRFGHCLRRRSHKNGRSSSLCGREVR
jgi:hypothetical protein